MPNRLCEIFLMCFSVLDYLVFRDMYCLWNKYPSFLFYVLESEYFYNDTGKSISCWSDTLIEMDIKCNLELTVTREIWFFCLRRVVPDLLTSYCIVPLKQWHLPHIKFVSWCWSFTMMTAFHFLEIDHWNGELI